MPVMASSHATFIVAGNISHPTSLAASENVGTGSCSLAEVAQENSRCGCDDGCSNRTEAVTGEPTAEDYWKRIFKESVAATWMVMQFMIIAFTLGALITLYVPQSTIVAVMGKDNPLAIALAALVGIPVYTSSMTALPLVNGLLEQGMAPGAALAFMIAGPTTTLPAMAAVYGIARRRVFVVYLGAVLIGAITLGYAYQFVLAL